MRKKLIALILVLVMVFSLQSVAFAASGGAIVNFQTFLALDFTDKIVFLHSNDVHGSIAGYAKAAGLRDAVALKPNGGVFLFDDGDFAQGSPYVGYNTGMDAINLMIAAGYDVATLGNHEFDYGYARLRALVTAATGLGIDIVSANIYENGTSAFPGRVMLTAGGTDIGVFGITTPETYTKANPALMTGLTFDAGAAMFATAQAQVDALTTAGADFIICLGHLGIDASSAGNRSTDLLAAVTGIDLFIDGHSHTVIDGDTNSFYPYTGGSMLTSTGSNFANIGAVVYNPADGTKESYIISTADISASELFPTKATVATLAGTVKSTVDAAMGTQIGTSDVLLEGGALNPSSVGNPDGGTIVNRARLQETNLGDLITDAMVWGAGEAGYPVDGAITNGGGIRKNIRIGNITEMDIYNVLPFGNYLVIINVTGAQLIKALEASTFSTPTTLGGFPQVSGIRYTVNTAIPYAPNASPYPGSTYYGPASIRRVTIQDVGGKGFSMTANYTLAVNNFMAAGGDTYYEFKMTPNQIEVGEQILNQTVTDYINDELSGVVGAAYAAPQGRIALVSIPAQVNYGPVITPSAPPASIPNTGEAVSAIGIVFAAMGAMLALGTVKVMRSKKRG